MRSALVVTLFIVLAGCQDITAPESAKETEAAAVAQLGTIASQPENRCYGAIVAGIATTWPWSHGNKSGFAPPPGAIARWIRDFGPSFGISSVRELQLLFC